MIFKDYEEFDMSIKEEGYLQDYLVAGLLGFAVGMAVGGAALSMIFSINLAAMVAGGGARWGETVALLFVAAIFGYLPGGFVAGYLNYRIHKTEGRPSEGLGAGFFAFLVHFVITLFVFITVAAMSGGGAGTVMGIWAISFAFAAFFYPIGGYLSGMIETRAIAMPGILKLEFAPAAPPIPPPPGAQTCPTCGGSLTYIQQYQRWYCQKCRKYV